MSVKKGRWMWRLEGSNLALKQCVFFFRYTVLALGCYPSVPVWERSHRWLEGEETPGRVETGIERRVAYMAQTGWHDGRGKDCQNHNESSIQQHQLTQQLRTCDHSFAFNELRLSWPHLNGCGELKWIIIATNFQSCFYVFIALFFVPHVLKTWSQCISRPEGSCCNLHLHSGGCVWGLHHSFDTLLQPTWAHSVITELPTSHPFVLTDLQ